MSSSLKLTHYFKLSLLQIIKIYPIIDKTQPDILCGNAPLKYSFFGFIIVEDMKWKRVIERKHAFVRPEKML